MVFRFDRSVDVEASSKVPLEVWYLSLVSSKIWGACEIVGTATERSISRIIAIERRDLRLLSIDIFLKDLLFCLLDAPRTILSGSTPIHIVWVPDRSINL